MTDAPRRWLRFSLRTMLGAFTVVTVWLGWNVWLIRERRNALSELGSQFEFATADEWRSAEDDRVARGRDNPAPAQINGLRRWMGDRAIQHYTLPIDVSQKTADRLAWLFPEAAVSGYGKPIISTP
jgi:hypothetical protein